MRHITFDTVDSPSIALLIKPSAFISYSLESHYVIPMCANGLSKQDIIAFDLAYDKTNKASAKTIKVYSKELLTGLKELGVKTLLVADSAYYKHLSGQSKAEANIGYVHKCVLTGFEDMSVIMSVNYQQMIYNPDLQEKLTRSLDTVVQHTQGTFVSPGASIIHSAYYPKPLRILRLLLENYINILFSFVTSKHLV
jgi:DNA polymerase-1